MKKENLFVILTGVVIGIAALVLTSDMSARTLLRELEN